MIVRLAPLLVAVLAAAEPAPASQTRKVFIVNIDGLRSTEGFEAGSLNLHFIWDSLKPLGTLYTNFYNTGVTVTNSAHSTIVTGARQLMLNNHGYCAPIRPREPTVGEAYRKHLGAPADQAVFVSGKPMIWQYPVSTYPGFGPACAPQVVKVMLSDDDLAVWDSTRNVIDRSHPSLCYILLGETDVSGHLGDTNRYLSSIRRADSLTFELWKLLRGDDRYRDSTTIIITSDHGRHDDHHGGWVDHGCSCHGCRHVLFLAIGPDIKADTIISARADQTDIAPTVASLLGFPMPYAQGHPLTAMLRQAAPTPDAAGPGVPVVPTDGDNISNSSGNSRSCDLAADLHAVHCVFSDNADSLSVIRYTRSTDGGVTWSAPLRVLDADGDAIEYADPALTTFGDSGLFVVATCCRSVPGETSYIWTLHASRSTNSGRTWEPEDEIESLGMVTSRPAVAAHGQRIEVVCLRENVLTAITSRDCGKTFGAPEHISSCVPHYPQFPAVALADTYPRVAWQDMVPSSHFDSTENHNIWMARRPWFMFRTMVTHNQTTSLSTQPSIDCDAVDPTGNIHLVYSDLREALTGTDWAATYQHGWARGDSWAAPVVVSGDHTGFAPVIKESGNGRLFCVWAELEQDEWFIAGSYSNDSGRTWSDPIRITDEGGLVAEPRLAASGDTCLVVWQKHDAGSWDIYFGSYAFPPSGTSERSPSFAPRFALSALPNPCHGRVTIRLSCPPAQPYSLSVYDTSGRLVRSSFGIRTSSFRLDLRSMPAGVYVLRAGSDRRFATTRLIVD